MSYESISLIEMDDFLRPRRFKPVDIYFRRRPVKEWVYERRLPQNANHFVRVYTTIQRYGGKTDQSRDVGKDAIRVQVIYRDEKGETLVSMPKRVNRVSTWRNNLDDRLKEIAESLPKVKMDRRGEPMTLRKKRGNLFWGSRDYPAYKETRSYGAEDTTVSRHQLIEDPDWLAGLESAIDSPTLLGKRIVIPFGDEWVEHLDRLMGRYQHGFLIDSGSHNNPDYLGAFVVLPMDSDNPLDWVLMEWDHIRSGGAEGIYDLVATLNEARYEPIFNDYLEAIGVSPSPRYDVTPFKTSVWKHLSGTRDTQDSINQWSIGSMVTKSTESEEIRCCKECNKTTGLSTIQAGTYCFDCLPINLGAESTNWNDKVVRLLKGYNTKVAGKLRIGNPNRGLVFDPQYRQRWDHWGDHYELEGWEDLYQEPLEQEIRQLLVQNGVDDAHAVVGEKGHVYISQDVQFEAEDDYDATYGKKQAKIRRRLKNKIMKQNIMGTKANKWSARKSQELKRQYEKACEKAGLASYRGSKTTKQDDLSNWSKQKWTTASGKKSSVTGEPYFPEKAVAALKKRGLYTKAKQQKQKANRSNKNARYSDDIREVVGQFRADETDSYENPYDPLINILLLEWAMLTNETYDSMTISKGLVDHIDDKPYDFVRHMQNQDLISLEPSARALVPAAFIHYLKDKDRDHWVNMKSRAIGHERYKYLKEKISDDYFWLSEVHKANYEQWLSRSAINYQNI